MASLEAVLPVVATTLAQGIPSDGLKTAPNGTYDVGDSAFGLERIPPTTAVAQPKSGTALARNRHAQRVCFRRRYRPQVEFHLTGGNYNDASIGVAGPTRFGWAYNWNTKSVPNGTYTLNSVAYDPAGNVGRSANVTITVRN